MSDDEFRAEGGLGLYELRDLAGVLWHSADVSTVGGFITAHFGHLPTPGEQVHVDEYLVTVEQVEGNRIERLAFKRQRPPQQPAGPDGITALIPPND